MKSLNMKIIFCLIYLLFTWTLFGQEKQSVKIIQVIDGDSLKIIKNGQKAECRLLGIDTPEFDQKWGREAKKYVSKHYLNKKVDISITGKDKYHRFLIIVHTKTGSLNEELVKLGLAWIYPKPCQLSQKLHIAQNEAKLFKKYIWSDNKSIAPWIHRKNKRLNKDSKSVQKTTQ